MIYRTHQMGGLALVYREPATALDVLEFIHRIQSIIETPEGYTAACMWCAQWTVSPRGIDADALAAEVDRIGEAGGEALAQYALAILGAAALPAAEREQVETLWSRQLGLKPGGVLGCECPRCRGLRDDAPPGVCRYDGISQAALGLSGVAGALEQPAALSLPYWLFELAQLRESVRQRVMAQDRGRRNHPETGDILRRAVARHQSKESV